MRPAGTIRSKILLLVLLLLLFLIPGIAYLVYMIRGNKMCPKCKTRKMIALDTPLGQKLFAQTGQAAAPKFTDRASYSAWKAGRS